MEVIFERETARIFSRPLHLRTEFSYDGLGRRTQIVEKSGGSVTSTKNFIWGGNILAEELDGNDNVTKRFYDEGEQIGGTGYLYTKDHLGSIREMVDMSGIVQTSYAYDPWGRRSYVLDNPAPVSGTKTQRSEIASGAHQHFFTNATSTLSIGTGDQLTCWVYLDPNNMPKELMFQWTADGSTWYRAYWGANLINYGPATYIGALPAAGVWTRLAVPASTVGAEGQQLNGMAFTLYDGRAWWDAAGERANGAQTDTIWVDDSVPAGSTLYTNSDTWTWATQSVDADFGYTGHYYHAPSGLELALYRAYDPDLGRWLSRDPLEMAELKEGPNLYQYVEEDPINNWDQFGLFFTVGPGWADICEQSFSSPQLSIAKGVPPNSQVFTAPNGQTFLAPAGTDFQAVYNAGRADGLFGANSQIGHYGKYDFQRNGGRGECSSNTFYPAYTDASNYGVGVYMNGAGFSLNQTITIGNLFAGTMSSNAGSARQQQWWRNGWNAAQSGSPNGNSSTGCNKNCRK